MLQVHKNSKTTGAVNMKDEWFELSGVKQWRGVMKGEFYYFLLLAFIIHQFQHSVVMHHLEKSGLKGGSSRAQVEKREEAKEALLQY